MPCRVPIVDAHHHFWDLDRNYHPWLCDEPMIPSRHGDYRAIRKNYLPADFRADWGHHHVVGSVYVEAEWDPTDPLGETRWVESVADETGLPSAIVAQAWLDQPNAREVLAAQAAHPRVRSVRQKPQTAPRPRASATTAHGSMSEPAFRAGFSALEPLGLHFDLQIPFWHLSEAYELARDFPNTQIILNHTGLPNDRSPEALERWRAGMQHLAQAPNVAVKISGLGEPQLPAWSVETHREVVLETIEIFGTERTMFASNYPVDALYASYEAIFDGFLAITADFSEDDHRALFHDNAIALYRLDL